jgi:hypothetical protein
MTSDADESATPANDNRPPSTPELDAFRDWALTRFALPAPRRRKRRKVPW